MSKLGWPPIEDEQVVEQLIASLQQIIVGVYDQHGAAGRINVHAGDTANVLLMLLASVLEQHPAATTPGDMRGLAEAAGKELGKMMRETRSLRLAERPSSIN